MSDPGEVALSAIGTTDLPRVAEFLHRELNTRVSARAWQDAVTPPWSQGPNHGFMLTSGEQVVGAYLAIYSEQPVRGAPEQFCNLAAWCVVEEHRAHGLRLARAMLGQRGYHFTDLSPSGNVVELNRRLRFTDLDTTTALVPNLPLRSRATVVTDLDAIAGMLDGRDREVFEDHRSAAGAHHVVLTLDGRHCYVVWRRERRKRLPVFASILYVGEPALLPRVWGALGARLLREGVLVTLSEIRVTGHRPRLSFSQRAPRPKMFRSRTLGPDDIGYLYSELACLAW